MLAEMAADRLSEAKAAYEASAMIAGVVLAGMAAMGAGAHFRRRNLL